MKIIYCALCKSQNGNEIQKYLFENCVLHYEDGDEVYSLSEWESK